MSSTDKNMLVDMGFSKYKVEIALNVTGHNGIEPAMEWLLAHPDCKEESSKAGLEENITESIAVSEVEEAASSNNQTITSEVVKSIKCDVCNKLFKTNLEIEFHATKSGHNKFSESNEEKKPLTCDEKKQQLQILEDKLRQKRKDREEKETKEALEKEKNRIRSGKEISQARKRFEELEMKKLLDQRKREKEEDKVARQRVKEQIEADKIARKSKSVSDDSKSTDTASFKLTSSIPVGAAIRKNCSETKLQIRLTNGQIITQNFGSKEQLSAVRLYVEMNRTDDSGPFSLMTNFPRKIFTDNDFDTPLDVLGLVPSAVIIVQKKFNNVDS